MPQERLDYVPHPGFSRTLAFVSVWMLALALLCFGVDAPEFVPVLPYPGSEAASATNFEVNVTVPTPGSEIHYLFELPGTTTPPLVAANSPLLLLSEALTYLRMKILATALEEYKRQLGEYPEGDAAQMLAVLMNRTGGDQNPQRTLFFQPGDKEMDNQGRLLDAWNRPFLIQYSRQKGTLQIMSAGSNGRFDGHRDDIVFRMDLLR